MMNELAGQGEEGGFSLVEVLIVIAIIGILATVAIPAYFNHMSRSRQSNAINELMAIRASWEMFYAENGDLAVEDVKIGELQFYTSAGTTPGAYYDDDEYGYYWYDIIDIDGDSKMDTIRARGDLDRDGDRTNIWLLTVDDLAAKPRLKSLGNEGFSWSALANIF